MSRSLRSFSTRLFSACFSMCSLICSSLVSKYLRLAERKIMQNKGANVVNANENYWCKLKSESRVLPGQAGLQQFLLRGSHPSQQFHLLLKSRRGHSFSIRFLMRACHILAPNTVTCNLFRSLHAIFPRNPENVPCPGLRLSLDPNTAAARGPATVKLW